MHKKCSHSIDFASLVEQLPDFDRHQQVALFHDEATSLHCVIAVHNTSRGPGVGGCRLWNYAALEDGVTDVLRLSRGMTYKNAMAELPFGGGKAVIFAPDFSSVDRGTLMAAFGRAIEYLDGTYCTAEDVGTTPDDMAQIKTETAHIFGLADTSGDPSPFTALGTFIGLQEAVLCRLKTDSLKGLHVAVQGLGHVGFHLCTLLHEAGARLSVSDVRHDSVQRVCDAFDATAVAPDAIYDVDADVYAPCALGATVNPDTMERLQVAVIAGAANNQLSDEALADELSQRNILYAPDYVINAGGIINIACECGTYNADEAETAVARIGPRLRRIFTRAASEQRSTLAVANQMARDLFTPNLESDIFVHDL